MFDPVGDATPSEDDTPHSDNAVKIEQLLLSGLDHYFKGRYEHAIDLWSRVLFLDRSHARARAYIDRARGALAEGLRESEELVHTGVEAFNRGDVAEARSLLTSAVQRGGGRDEALTVLDRLDRLEGASGDDGVEPRGGGTVASGRRVSDHPTRVPTRRVRVVPLVLLVAVSVGLGYLGLSWGQWRPLVLGAPTHTAARPLVTADPLPVPSGAELRLGRARRLIAEQRLHEALSVLATIGSGEMLSGEADALTATIQAQLLATAQPPASPVAGAVETDR